MSAFSHCFYAAGLGYCGPCDTPPSITPTESPSEQIGTLSPSEQAGTLSPSEQTGTLSPTDDPLSGCDPIVPCSGGAGVVFCLESPSGNGGFLQICVPVSQLLYLLVPRV